MGESYQSYIVYACVGGSFEYYMPYVTSISTDVFLFLLYLDHGRILSVKSVLV